MGKRDAQYKLKGQLEIDEGFFSSVLPLKKDEHGNNIPREPKRRGKGNPRSAVVLVMVESVFNSNPKKHQVNRAVKHIKMEVIEKQTLEILNSEISRNFDPESVIMSDDGKHYGEIKDFVREHHPTRLNRTKIKANTLMPWVHKAIANGKRNFLGMFSKNTGSRT